MGHHYVPQEYLRGFAVPGDDDSVWLFDKRRRRWSLAAIDKVAQERDYFTPEVEQRLADEVESPANRVLKRLREAGQFKLGDREALSLYIAVLIKRVPRARRKAYELVPEVLTSTVAELRKEITAALGRADPERLATLLAEIDVVEARYRDKPPPSVVEQINTPTVAKEMVKAIERMVWRFVLRPPKASPFVTSDHPAFYFDAYGVDRPNAELTFPISPDLALLGSHQGEPRSTLVVLPTKAIAKEINRRVASGAERFVFSSVHAKWVETLALRKNPYLNRIGW